MLRRCVVVELAVTRVFVVVAFIVCIETSGCGWRLL
jgi:hypothetical protein